MQRTKWYSKRHFSKVEISNRCSVKELLQLIYGLNFKIGF